jgi:molybdopterin synthase catalytic subunit
LSIFHTRVAILNTETGVHEERDLSLSDLVSRVKTNEDFAKVGGIALFIGVVRGENDRGERVQKLALEAYEEEANKVLSRIRRDLEKKPGIVDVQIHHFLGEFNAGEDMVYVLVAGSHRQSIFPVLEEAVERYKKEAPIFKKEYVITSKGNTGSHWVTEDEKVLDV